MTRVDPASGAVAGPSLRTGERPSAIALGAGGVWVVNEGSGTLTPISLAARCSREAGGPRRVRAENDGGAPQGPARRNALFGRCYLMKPVAPTALRIVASDLRVSKLAGAGVAPLMKRIHEAWRASTVAIVPGSAEHAGLEDVRDLTEVGADAGVLENLRRRARTSPCR